MNTKVIKDVVVQIGGDPSKLKEALGQSISDLTGWSTKAKVAGAAAATAFVAVGTSLVALTKASLQNVDALAKQARGLGLTTAAFQDMALVAEEAGVASESLSAVLGIMQRNIAELQKGTEAQVEAFGALGLTLRDLQSLGPDAQFAKIAEALDGVADPARKTALAMEIFGRSGRATINMLGGYSDAVANAADFNRTFGITLTQTESDSIESANDAVGRLGMVFEGLGNRLAVIVAPALEATAVGFVNLAAAMFGAEEQGLKFFNTMSNYQAIMENFGSVEAAAALAGGWQELENILSHSNAIEVLDQMAYAFDDLQTTANQATSAMAGDIAALADEYPILSEALGNMSAEVDRLSSALQSALDAGDIEAASQYREQLGIAVENLQKAVTQADALSGLDLSGSISWADSLALAFEGLAAAARDAVAAAQEVPGMDTGTPLSGDVGGLMPPSVDGVTSSPRPRAAPPMLNEPAATPGRGGVGGTNPWESRLESLVSALATEKETLQLHYEESLETLRGARESELLTQEEYNQRMLEVQQQFQDSMKAIDQQAFQQKRDAWSGALGDLASLMTSGSKKMFNIGKAAALAQAAVDGWSAAVSAWDKGMKIGGPPVAAAFAAFSVVRTGAMIANIASQQFGGGAVTGGGAGGGSVPAADAGPTGVTNVTIQGDVIGRNTGDALVKQINEAIAAGHRINLEWQGAM